MKLVIQRVTSSSLYIEGSLISQIKQGLVVLIGISKSDSENAEHLYNKFLERLNFILGDKLKTGKFGANMQVELVNDGPVTIIIENS